MRPLDWLLLRCPLVGILQASLYFFFRRIRGQLVNTVLTLCPHCDTSSTSVETRNESCEVACDRHISCLLRELLIERAGC